MLRTTALILLLAAAAAHGQTWELVDVPEEPGLYDLGVENGIVWISTQGQGLVGYDGSQWVAHTESSSGMRQNRWNYNLLVDSAGRKWVTRDGSRSVDRLDDAGTFADLGDDVWSYYDSPEQLLASRIFSTAEAPDGSVWFGVRDENHDVLGTLELFIDNSDTTTADDVWLHFDNYLTPADTEFADDDVRELAVDADGRLWIGYNAAGVDVWDYGDPTTFEDDSWEHYTKETVLPNNSIADLHVGPDGRVWVATLGGLAVHDPASGSWETVSGLPGLRAQAVSTDAQGHPWVATDDGVAMLYADGSIAFAYDTEDGLEDDDVTDLVVDADQGVVWVITKDSLTDDDHLHRFESGILPGLNEVYAYPNPWRESSQRVDMTIYGAPDGSTVEIFDITGERVRKLESREPYFWDTLDDDAYEVASGVYIVRIEPPSGGEVLLKVAVIR